ncbi:hypothetical protein ACP4OV_031544 [Aristida adscensionis]
MYSTAFRIDPDLEQGNCYLVTHTDQSRKYAWYQHSFVVHANESSGQYACECRTWEHTGLFCAHLLKAFTHLQIKKIPSDYVLKRYTRDARIHVMWDRHDIVTVGPDCTTEQFRTSKLVTLAMDAVRACRKSSIGFNTGCEDFIALRELADTISSDINMTSAGGARKEQNVDMETPIADVAPLIASEIEISTSAPREAQTKGSRKRGRNGSEVDEAGSSREGEKKGSRICGYCGLMTNHYATTCRLNPANAAKVRGGRSGRRGMMGGRRGRPPTNRQLHAEFEDVA